MKWNRAARLASPLAILLALAACGQGQAPVAPASESAAAPTADLPVMGPEVPMVALGDSLFAGDDAGVLHALDPADGRTVMVLEHGAARFEAPRGYRHG